MNLKTFIWLTIGLSIGGGVMWWGYTHPSAPPIPSEAYHSDPPPPISWLGSLEEASDQAQDEQKLILIHFTSPREESCVQMRAAFENGNVRTFVPKIFVPVLSDTAMDPALAKRYGIPEVPATVVTDPTGETLTMQSGLLEAPALLDWLETARHPPEKEPEPASLPQNPVENPATEIPQESEEAR